MSFIQPKPAGSQRNSFVMEVASAVVEGHRYEARSRNSGEATLARILVEAGVPDQPWTSYTPTGTPALRGRSIHRLALTSIKEADGESLRVVRYQPHPLITAGARPASDPEDGVE